MHMPGLVAVEPAGRASECVSPASFTWNGSLPLTTAAPPVSVNFGAAGSNEPPGRATYVALSPQERNGCAKLTVLPQGSVPMTGAPTLTAAIALDASTPAATTPVTRFRVRTILPILLLLPPKSLDQPTD